MSVQRVSEFLRERPRLRPSRGRLAAVATILFGFAISNLPWLSADTTLSPHSLPFQVRLESSSAAQGRPAGGGGGGDIIVFDILGAVAVDAMSRLEGDFAPIGMGSTSDLQRLDRYGRPQRYDLPSGIYLIVFEEADGPELGILLVDADAGFVLGLRYQF